MNSFFSEDELKELGLKEIGMNVLISKKTSIYGAENICIGDNVRIDDFCILSGKIRIKNYVHISAGVYLYGGESGIEIEDFAGISSKTTIYAVSDDFSGEFLVGSLIPYEYRNVISKKVFIRSYVQLGAGNIVLPGVLIEEGVATGAGCVINKSLKSWTIYIGAPARKLKCRSKKVLDLGKELLEKGSENN